MSIKWEDYRILVTSLSNQIVLGKIESGSPYLEDGSDDRTKEAVAAVTEHMRKEYERRKRDDPKIKKLEFTFSDGRKLIYEPPAEGGVEGE